jgi:hypothetical protein
MIPWPGSRNMPPLPFNGSTMLGRCGGTRFWPSGTVAITSHHRASKWEGWLCSKWEGQLRSGSPPHSKLAHTCDERERRGDKEDGGKWTVHRKRIERQLLKLTSSRHFMSLLEGRHSQACENASLPVQIMLAIVTTKKTTDQGREGARRRVEL